MDLTLRQLYALHKIIDKRIFKKSYTEMEFYAKIHGAKMPSLGEILPEENRVSFDEKTDKLLDDRAKKIFDKMRESHGRQRTPDKNIG